MTKGFIRELLLLSLAIVMSVIFSFYLQNIIWEKIPILQSKTDEKVSHKLEKEFAEKILNFIKADDAIIKDPAVAAAVDSIVNRLNTTIDSFPDNCRILVIENDQINAVALPGGIIIIFSALLRVTESSEEFASVLAHEIAHVINRDPLKRMIRQFGISTVLSVMTGNTPFLQNTIETLLDCTYTKEQESEADSLAFDMLINASINPKHFATLMNRLSQDSGETSIIQYFSTHPAMIERIQKANSKAITSKLVEQPLLIDWNEVKKGLPSIFN